MRDLSSSSGLRSFFVELPSLAAYPARASMPSSSTLIQSAVEWYIASDSSPKKIFPEVCGSRDQFQARLDNLYQEIIARKIISENETSLLVSVVGEIGNNCFDHNLGQWKDQAGCWFSWTADAENLLCLIADRGQGLLNSLKRVKPDLKDESEALKIAFEKKLSGRSPEQRGNGLKFVRTVINQHPNRSLLFWSGSDNACFGNTRLEKYMDSVKITKQGTGTLALLIWSQK